ncbi:MAG: IS66 family insertion sequence element accessory protein TnpB [Gammaproteobacteria bacterium]|nr:IS66 family insertion sequence element accessory protein TnpB [Gammaproteobacteria bacterium]
MSKSGTRRARRTPAQWEALLAEQARSGLSQEAFCRLQGLGYSTFCAWRARCGKRATGRKPQRSVAPRATFIELPSFAPPAATISNDTALHVELTLGHGWVLRIGRR